MTILFQAWGPKAYGAAALLAAALLPCAAFAQATPPLSTCAEQPDVPACGAVPGDRAEGWGGQSRAEVMAPHGMVTTSQPLAAQAGLQIMQRGGNAIDAAVAAAAVLNVVEPMNTGMGGDLFVIIYVAKEKKLHVLNASGMAPTGATLARYNSLGYRADPRNWGPGSGMPGGGILTVTVPGSAWGWEEVLTRFGKLTFKEVLQPAIDYADNGFPVSNASRSNGGCPALCRCAAAARRSTRIRSPPGTSTASRRSPARPTAIAISPRPSGCCRSRAATSSTRARSRARSWPNRPRSAAP